MSAFKKPEEIGKRPAPGALDPKWTYLGFVGRSEYNFDLYRSEGLDSLHFADPRDDPQPRELEDGSLDLGLDRERMTYLRDLFTYLLDNWGRPETRQSHPEDEA